MDTAELIEHLSEPRAYPHSADDLRVHQTHISVVFLAGSFAYKIKKPLNLGFLDFTTLERRKFYCEEEVRLNRRLAPDTYLGVVALRRGADGCLRVDGDEEGPGEVVEWAVRMVRLPEEATLLQRLRRGEDLDSALVELGALLRDFHDRAESGEEIAAFGRPQSVAQNALENFTQAAPSVNRTVSREVLERLEERTRQHLAELQEPMERRVREGEIRDTHGDLHLDHVYWFSDRERDRRFVIVDCIEFNRRFRYADPVADLAFLVMDLWYHDRGDWARVLENAYFGASGDQNGRELVPFYTAYRAAVRAKVEGFEVAEKEVPGSERGRALSAARAHWLLALGRLESPGRRPVLLCVTGLPGTGKSTLAERLGREAGCDVIASDRVRKELAGLDPDTPAPAPFGEGLYTENWNDRTYSECLRRTREALFRGRRVIVDAGFREEHRRREFLREARDVCVPFLILECTCDDEVVRHRLERREGGRSDADWNIYRAAKASRQPATAETARVTHTIDSGVSPDRVLQQASALLRREEVL